MVRMQNLKKELMFITDGNGLHNSCMIFKYLIALEPLKGILILMKWSGRVEVILSLKTHGYKSRHFI